jgi:hypothetical protein
LRNEREVVEEAQKVLWVTENRRRHNRTGQGKSGWDGTAQVKAVEESKEETKRQ